LVCVKSINRGPSFLTSSRIEAETKGEQRSYTLKEKKRRRMATRKPIVGSRDKEKKKSQEEE